MVIFVINIKYIINIKKYEHYWLFIKIKMEYYRGLNFKTAYQTL